MTVSLNISNDAELRAHIKDQIVGQIRSIAREDVMNILREEIAKKTPTINPDTVLVEEVKKRVTEVLAPARYSMPSEITKMAREILEVELRKLLQNGGLTLK